MKPATVLYRGRKLLFRTLLLFLFIPKVLLSQWTTLNGGVPGWAFASTVYNGELFVGGDFGIMKWDGSSWGTFGGGIKGSVKALTVYNNKLVAAGYFSQAGKITVNYIAEWDGSKWNDLQGGTNGYVVALAVYKGDLIIGGYFTLTDAPANYIAKWNGHNWSTLGSGMGGREAQVMALTVYGNELVATGFFTSAGGSAAYHVAKWNGSTWTTLSTGLSGIGYCLTSYDNKLIAGGLFSYAGGVSANNVASWNGSTWAALGTGVGGGPYGYVFALAVYNNELVAGGIFTRAGETNAANIAKWNGRSWSAMATTMNSSGTVQGIYAFTTLKNKLLAIGMFNGLENIGAQNIAAYEPKALPVKLISFTANARYDGAVVLNWTSAAEIAFNKYEVEHGSDGIYFSKKGESKGGLSAYSFIDLYPLKGTNYYRLKILDVNGTYIYSVIRTLNLNPSEQVKINSTPTGNVVNITGIHLKELKVFTPAGELLLHSNLTDSLNSISADGLVNGTYIVYVSDTSGKEFKEKLVVKH